MADQAAGADLVLPRTVEGVFKDFVGRRSGIIKALTTEVEAFYSECDPERENLCLYGLPDESWKVTLPEEEVPPELPEPALGINFARDGMLRRDWLSLVAVHSDAWLMSVGFFLGARFDRNERNCLFQMINNLATVLEVIAGTAKPVKDMASVNDSPFNLESRLRKRPQSSRIVLSDDSKEDSSDVYVEEDMDSAGEDDQDSSTCGSCGDSYVQNEFWICCDVCGKWYHGKCVKVTPARAEHMKTFKCPMCRSGSVLWA